MTHDVDSNLVLRMPTFNNPTKQTQVTFNEIFIQTLLKIFRSYV